MVGTIRILIRSDVRLYGDGIRLVLEREPGVEVVGSADPDDRFGGLAKIGELQPDVILLDSATADVVTLIRQIQQIDADIKIVALALQDSDREILGWAEAGISGYVTRDGSAADLVATIRSAARGEALCSPRVAARLMQRVAALARDDPARECAGLTPRELQIVRLIDEGLSNKEIAVRLCVGVSTVKSHVHSILEKLGARRRGQVGARLRASALSPGP
ncbi:MAG: hypothetical protein AVDCRST_MAG67-4289 [uncultured Solirubrobacteraceae bacterium]|uniref:Two-component transcriptional response regulator, LuxR family n=1 Tax=uncultured Solirubrobacteraceae bacterium TaxID=1162706 RepID=A0A6J4TTP7_9ACTN|nr:MAG: hypothetical protein AVDCRST_MAG67-4289 [uncultured Solirubrobacteraceae bacterium]